MLTKLGQRGYTVHEELMDYCEGDSDTNKERNI